MVHPKWAWNQSILGYCEKGHVSCRDPQSNYRVEDARMMPVLEDGRSLLGDTQLGIWFLLPLNPISIAAKRKNAFQGRNRQLQQPWFLWVPEKKPSFTTAFSCIRSRYWASLLAQWLRIRLPMQGTRVRALVWEDPTYHGATKLVCHNYWACTLEPTSHNCWAHVPQLLKPVHLEPMLCNMRSHQSEKPAHCNEVTPTRPN